MTTTTLPEIEAPGRLIPVTGAQTMTSPGGLSFRPAGLIVGPTVGGRPAYIAAIGPVVGGGGWNGSRMFHSCAPRRAVPGWAQDALVSAGLGWFGLTDDEAAACRSTV